MRLYELPEALRALDEEIEANGGELTPELEARLDELAGNSAELVDRVCALIREHVHKAGVEYEEAAYFHRKAKASEAVANRLKRYLSDTMARVGYDRLEGDRFKVRIQKNGTPSIKWEGFGDIPTEFARVSVELDGTKAREAWKNGTLPLGFTVQVGTHVRID